MFLQRKRPNQCVARDVPFPGGIDAFQPGFVFPPPEVPASRDINPVLIKDRYGVEIARTLATVAVVLMNICFRAGWIKIELPNLLKECDGGGIRDRGNAARFTA